ncbi:Tn3 family transposase [Nonomuraea sp. CA-143628]|uniref:Tn3 family transposase n=1 Tax=Nonomuraea sp. CA-143628 TaxID=3239997 RepID=UPI003D93F064
MLDDSLDMATDLPLFEHTTDTHGVNLINFALFDLVGKRLSPRIRDLGKIILIRDDAPPLRRDLHYAQQGAVTRPVLADQTDQAWCLTVSTNAVITWTTDFFGVITVGVDAELAKTDGGRHGRDSVIGKWNVPVESYKFGGLGAAAALERHGLDLVART